jgi:hypothetical protein
MITDKLSPSVNLRDLKKNYCKYHCHCDRSIDGLFDDYMSKFIKGNTDEQKKSSMKLHMVFFIGDMLYSSM